MILDAASSSSTLVPSAAIGSPVPTLADAIRMAEASAMYTEKGLRELRYAVNAIVKFTGRVPESISATPEALRPLVRSILPAARGMKSKRFSNIKSLLTKLCGIAGQLDERVATKTALEGAWLALWESLPTIHDRAEVAPFFRFCARHDLAPTDVTQAVVEQYREWRSSRTMLLRVTIHINSIRRIWNHARGKIEGWPTQHLPGRKNPAVYVMPPESFPESFREDVLRLLDSLAHPDPFFQRRKRKSRPRRSVTITEYRRFAYRAATILALNGTDPASITSLAAIVTPAAVKTILLDLHRRHGDDWTGNAATMANNLYVIASDFVRVSDEHLAQVGGYRLMVSAPSAGLSAKNLHRLAQFERPGAVQALLDLPARCFEAVERRSKESRLRAAELHERTLAILILLTRPIRLRNLVGIHIQRNILRDATGKIVSIEFPKTETKNNTLVQVAVTEELAQAIDRHLKVHRPLLSGAETEWLFGSPKGGHRHPATLARHVSKLVGDMLGAEFNVHLTRHLMATLMFKEFPDGDALVQHLLGHSDPRTTSKSYGIQRGAASQKELGNILDRLRSDPLAALRQSLGRGRSSQQGRK